MLFKFVYQFDECTVEDAKGFLLGEHGLTLADDLVKISVWLARRDVREVKMGLKSVK